MSGVSALQTTEAAARRSLADELSGTAIRSVRRSGLLAAVAFLALVGFAAFVPIASGALAEAQLAVEGERKVVQHPTGGVVTAILVREGDEVAEGDVVLRLDPIQAGAAAGVLNTQVDALRAEEAARMAEASGAADVVFAEELMSRQNDPRVAAVMASEKAAFDGRRDMADSQRQQLTQQLSQTQQSIVAARAQREGQLAQARLLEEELETLQPLLEKGLALRSRLLALERALEDARGRAASLEADGLGLTARAEELRALRDRVEIDRKATAAERLRVLRAELSAAQERQIAAADTLNRTEVRAPTSGIAMAVNVTTVGGVVEAGKPLLEVVPQAEQLVARARVAPRVADDVRRGMPATVRLTASGAKAIPPIEGVVLSVSADALEDPRTGTPYFEVRVAIPPEEAKKAPSDVIAPGLPAEVLIRTGSHTLLQYFFSPVDRAIFRSLRES